MAGGNNLLPNFQTVDHTVLTELSDHIGRRWKTVGRRLGFSEGQLDQIEMDNPENSWDKIYCMLDKWAGQPGDAKTKATTLKDTLQASGFSFKQPPLQASGFSCKQPQPQSDLPKLCEECLLEVADETLELQPVINVLGNVDKSFFNHLNNDIITSDKQEEIKNASNSSEALGLIRRALKKSLVPDKLHVVIQELRKKESKHAEQIKNSYHTKIREHKCDKCDVEGKH